MSTETVSAFHPVMAWLTGGCSSLPLPSITRGSRRISLAQGRAPNSSFEAQFLPNAYLSHTIIELKNPKSNHSKLGTICSRIFDQSCFKQNLKSQLQNFLKCFPWLLYSITLNNKPFKQTVKFYYSLSFFGIQYFVEHF